MSRQKKRQDKEKIHGKKSKLTNNKSDYICNRQILHSLVFKCCLNEFLITFEERSDMTTSSYKLKLKEMEAKKIISKNVSDTARHLEIS